jgi:superfamily II DNA or RNA helicase
MNLRFREYQTQAIEAVLSASRRGRKRVSVCSPVGSGKTVIMAELCRLARRPMVISPSLALFDQLHSNLRVWLDEGIDLEQGLNRAATIQGLRRRVVVASARSLLSRDRYLRTSFNDISLVIVDECHIGITPVMIKMLSYFESIGAVIVGLSATPFKGKGKPLPYWDRPCYSYSLLQAINDGYLVRPIGHMSESKTIDLSLVDKVANDWNATQLQAVLTAEHAVQEIASLVMQTFKRQPSAVYCQSILQAKMVAEVLQRYGIKVSIVYSKQSPDERQANMDAFTSGQSKVIVNVNVLAYGWDFPELKNIYNAAPTMSLAVYEQRIGRGTRALKGVIHPDMNLQERLASIAASDKPNFNIYDITDTSRSIQLVNALDVLDAACRDNAERRERAMKAMTAGVDIIEEAGRQDAIEDERKVLEREELKAKRQHLIVGMTFDHTNRDLFAAPSGEGQPVKERGWRMLYGKYRGQTLRSLPEDYLRHVADTTMRKKDSFHVAVRKELRERRNLRELLAR